MKKTITRKKIFNTTCKVISYTLATLGIVLAIGSVGAFEDNNISFVQFIVQFIIGCGSTFLALVVSGVRQYVTGDYIVAIEE